MKKICFSLFILFILSACSSEESIEKTPKDTDEDTPQIEEIELPSSIFTSKKNNTLIDEEEMKQSIKVYLDSSEDLFNASYQFEEIIDSDQKLNEKELEKFEHMKKLIKENDHNFSNYISNNTLPEGYKKGSKRISQYITASNQLLEELDQAINDINEGDFSEVNIGSVINGSTSANGREQKKIEDFLDKKNIDTKAFGRKG
ncbi:NDxxF motif lipoprotein [Priestia filamentosa]|uniref:NDxxF motif lipoprotein n=1 Tax=Priestia filamentosa TaxID=1402861 RepID=UPI003981D437